MFSNYQKTIYQTFKKMQNDNPPNYSTLKTAKNDDETVQDTQG